MIKSNGQTCLIDVQWLTNPNVQMLGFYQEVNGQMYSLKNGAYNPLALVNVSGV